MIIVNTPHNPVGKVFTLAELEKIAALAEEFNLLVMADEVVRLGLSCLTCAPPNMFCHQYDCLVFDNKEHVRIATLPGMWERTVTVGSAGSKYPYLLMALSYLSPVHLESFAATGWRVGWLIGPPSIITPTLAATTRIVFCSNSPLQEAAAAGLEQAVERRFFENQLEEYQERRDVFVSAFDQLGVTYTLPEGTYFVLMVPFFFFCCTGIVLISLHRTHPKLNSPMITPSRKACQGEVVTSSMWSYTLASLKMLTH
jgi:kynurenine aminotransferase